MTVEIHRRAAEKCCVGGADTCLKCVPLRQESARVLASDLFLLHNFVPSVEHQASAFVSKMALLAYF